MRKTIERVTCDLCGRETKDYFLIPYQLLGGVADDKHFCSRCRKVVCDLMELDAEQNAPPSRQDRPPDAPEVKDEDGMAYRCFREGCTDNAAVVVGYCDKHRPDAAEAKAEPDPVAVAEGWMLRHGKGLMGVSFEGFSQWFNGYVTLCDDADNLAGDIFAGLPIGVRKTNSCSLYRSRRDAIHALGVALLKLEAEKAKGTT